MRNEELRTAQTELAAVKARYTDLYDSAPVGYVTLDPSGQITQANLAAASLLGLERAGLMGRSFEATVAEADRRSLAECLRRLFAGEPTPSCEVALAASATAERHVLLTATRSADGQECLLVVVGITARQQAEAELQASEGRWRFALEGAGDGVWDWDLPAGTLFFSKRYQEMLGYAEDEFGTGPEEWSSRIHPEDRPRVMADLRPHLDGVTAGYANEHRVLCKDGSYKWILARGLVIGRDPAGKPLRMVGTQTDVSVRKQAELREATHDRTMTALVGGAPLAEVLTALVRGVEAEHPGTLGSVLLLDAAGTHLLTGAAPSLPAFYNEAIHGVAIGPAVGSCGVAAFTGERVLVADIQTDPLWTDHKALAAQAGLAACWSEPIRGTRGRVVGTFAFYHAQPRLPGAAEIGTIVAAAQLAAVAIERSQVNEALRRSTQLLEASQATAKVGGWELDLGTRQLFWTAETYRLHGTSPEEFNPTMDAGVDYYLPESRRILSAALQAAMERGEGYDLMLEIRTTKGRRIDVRTTCAVTLQEGRPAKLTGIFQDITERNAAEASLRSAVESKAAILDALPAHIALLDPQGKILAVNESWRRFASANASRSPDFLVGRNYLAVCESAVGECSSEAQGVAAGLRDVLEGRLSHFEFEYPCHSPKEQRWFRLMATPLTPGGRDGVVVMHVNITARKLAESQLRLLEASVAQINEGVMITEANFATEGGPTIVFANAAMERISGYTRAELIGKTPRLFQGPRTDRAVLDRIREALSRRAATHVELINYTKAGDEYWVELSLTPVVTADGAVSHFVSIETDITARRAAAAALQASRDRLDYLVASSPAVIYTARASGDYGATFISQNLEKQVGFTPEEFLADPGFWASHLHPDDVLEVLKNMEGLFGHGSHVHEYRFRQRDGSYRWMRDECRLIRDAAGAPVEVLGYWVDITERKESEIALQDSEEQYRALFDSSPVPLALNDAGQNIVRVNAAFEATFGYTLADIPTLADWWPKACPDPEYRRWVAETWQERLARAAQDGIKFQALELTICCRDGTSRIVMAGAADLGTTMAGLHLVVLYDMTDRKAAEIALQESNRALQLFSRCNEAMVHSENEADLLATICQIAVAVGGYRLAWVGYAQEDERKTVLPQAHAGEENGYLAAIQVTWSDTDPSGAGPSGRVLRSGEMLVVPDLAADETCAPWLAAAHAQGYLGLICLPLKSQTRTFGVLTLYLPEVRIPGANELQLLKELADDLAFGLGVLRVRAERHQAAQEIARQAALLDQATDAIFVTDLNHRITYWSKGAERLYGWSPAEALGESSFELLHKADEAGEDVAYQLATDQTLAAGEWRGEFTKLTKADGQLAIEARWTLLRDDQGAPLAILAINTDFTERKKLERQFLRVQRMESIGTLAGGIAHDLNNVLGPIMMSLDLLRMRFPDPASQELISIIDASAQHGAGMVRQVLSFGRGVEGRKLEVQVKHLIKEIEKIANETFLKHVQVRTIVPHDLWPVIGDPTQLHQVLLNLCVNARDAMPQGGTLIISAENLVIDAQYASANLEALPGPYIALQVEDSGTGMPPEVIEKIFDPFFTTKELGKGTGLGLSTSLGIVQSHGGFLRVDSELGHGSKFKVYLPAQAEASPEALAAAAAEMPRGDGELILVIDDEAAIRQITEQTLKAYGYRVVVAADGAAAIALFAPRIAEIAAVLTDMMMPVMDGLATIRILRRMNPRLPIIAASGLDTDRKADEVASLGVKHFLLKPYTAATLLKVLKQALAEEMPGR